MAEALLIAGYTVLVIAAGIIAWTGFELRNHFRELQAEAKSTMDSLKRTASRLEAVIGREGTRVSIAVAKVENAVKAHTLKVETMSQVQANQLDPGMYYQGEDAITGMPVLKKAEEERPVMNGRVDSTDDVANILEELKEFQRR